MVDRRIVCAIMIACQAANRVLDTVHARQGCIWLVQQWLHRNFHMTRGVYVVLSILLCEIIALCLKSTVSPELVPELLPQVIAHDLMKYGFSKECLAAASSEWSAHACCTSYQRR